MPTPEEQQQFVNRLWPTALTWSQRTGLPPELFVAISASETNWGNAPSAFGIKGEPGAADTTYLDTWEYENGQRVNRRAPFRTYPDDESAFADFVALITEADRYAPAYQAFQQHGDPWRFLQAVNQAGYATDPRWHQNVRAIAGTITPPPPPPPTGTAGGGVTPLGRSTGATTAMPLPERPDPSAAPPAPPPVPAPMPKVLATPALPLPPFPSAPKALPGYDQGGVVGGNQQQFIARLWPLAVKYAGLTGIPPEVFVAMGASETNWGNAGSIFGIKGRGTAGSRAYNTYEVVNGRAVNTRDNFAVYQNDEDAFQAFVGLVSAGRYKPAWDRLQAGQITGYQFVQEINRAGYATDPQWASKIETIARRTVLPAIPDGAPAWDGQRRGSVASTGNGNRTAAPALRAPVPGPITQGFGPTSEPLDGPYGGYKNFNKGNDYGVPVGTPVQSVTGGRVIAAGSGDDGWGVRVQVQAADGTIHNYGHLSTARVKVGDTVQPGQVIAASGNTGRSTGPHLSWDIWRVKADGSPEYIDPAQYLRQGGGGRASMVNQPSTQPRAVDPDIEAIIKTSREAYTQATAERVRLQAQLNKPGLSPNDLSNLETQFKAAQDRELAEADNYRQALALRVSANKPTAQGQQDTPLDYARYDLEVTKAENEVTQAGWSNELALLRYMDESNRGWANLARELLEGNRTDVREAIKIATDQGALRLQASAAVLDAHVKQQAAELARAGAILERAKFIREGFELLATRLLPAGTDYQPGFEPSGALNQALAVNNVPTLTIRTVQTPLAYLDPREQLRMSDDSLRETGYGRPNLNPQIQGVEREYSTIRNLTPYTAQAITPAQVGLRTPGATGEDGTPLAAPTFLSPAAAARTFWDDLAREQPPAPGEPAAGEPPGSAAQPAGTLPLGVDATVAPYQQPSGSQPLVGGPINWAGPQQPVTPDRQQPAGAYPNPGGQNSPNPDRRDQQRFSTSVTRAQGAVTAAVGAAVPQIATPAPTGPVLQPRPAGPVPGPSPARNLNAPQANEIVYRDPVTGEYVVGGVRFQPGRTVGSLRGSA